MRSVLAFSASFVVFYLFAPYVIAGFALAFVFMARNPIISLVVLFALLAFARRG
jgi:hypothetical protein